MQPFYLFLPKHFHQVQLADLYIFMDDTQFVKNGHHNRNRIKGPDGHVWLTVPVRQKGRFGQTIADVEINNQIPWRRKHWQSIRQFYGKAPFFKTYAEEFEAVYAREWEKLADLNIHFIKMISRLLGITNTRFQRLSELDIQTENPTQRLIDNAETVGADRYFIGTRAKDYMEEERWEKTSVELVYFEPQYPPYPQQGEGFLEYCSIIDLLFNTGPEAGEYIWGKYFQRFQEQQQAGETLP